MTQNFSGTDSPSAASTSIEIDFSPLTSADAALARAGGAGRLRFRAYHRKRFAAENGLPGKTDAEWIADAADLPHAREMMARHPAAEQPASHPSKDNEPPRHAPSLGS
jgi:hypothetical protein